MFNFISILGEVELATISPPRVKYVNSPPIAKTRNSMQRRRRLGGHSDHVPPQHHYPPLLTNHRHRHRCPTCRHRHHFTPGRSGGCQAKKREGYVLETPSVTREPVGGGVGDFQRRRKTMGIATLASVRWVQKATRGGHQGVVV